MAVHSQAPCFTQLPGILAENILGAAKIMREEMDLNIADSNFQEARVCISEFSETVDFGHEKNT